MYRDRTSADMITKGNNRNQSAYSNALLKRNTHSALSPEAAGRLSLG